MNGRLNAGEVEPLLDGSGGVNYDPLEGEAGVIDPSSRVPLYHQLKEGIRRKILRGEYKEGDLLPTEREFAEQVICYRKTVRLLPQEVFGQHRRRSALTDILRYNVRNLLYTMDEPHQSVHVVDEHDHTPKTVDAVRSYHLNVVLRFRGDDGAPYLYQKLRVVLSRQGIRRVEQIPLGLAELGEPAPPRERPPRPPAITEELELRPHQRRRGHGTTPRA